MYNCLDLFSISLNDTAKLIDLIVQGCELVHFSWPVFHFAVYLNSAYTHSLSQIFTMNHILTKVHLYYPKEVNYPCWRARWILMWAVFSEIMTDCFQEEIWKLEKYLTWNYFGPFSFFIRSCNLDAIDSNE